MLKEQKPGIIVDKRLGEVKRYFLTPPNDYNMWIPDEIKKCVAFLCVENTNGDKIPRGTGFFVSVPSEKYPNERHFIYFVTAKHIIASIGKRKFWLRINGNDGNLLYLEGDNTTKWFYHPDHANNPADVAVIPFSIDIETMDVKTIPWGMIEPTPALIKSGDLGIGNEVFITGLFTKLSGRGRNLPIVRMGNIAMIPDEKVPVAEFGDIDAYLIESRSIGGVSGSPVFFCRPPQTDKGFSPGINMYLGGLIHGHWDTFDQRVDNFLPELDAGEIKKEGMVNMGIAIVTPVIKIIEVLNCEKLKNIRTEGDKITDVENSPTFDSYPLRQQLKN